MLQFLQDYGVWIAVGVMFLLMMRMHGTGGSGGGCCGSGGHQQEPRRDDERQGDSEPTAGGQRHSGGCHWAGQWLRSGYRFQAVPWLEARQMRP